MHQAADTEHWHHLSRGFCPLITSAINHQALLCQMQMDWVGEKKCSLGLDFHPPICMCGKESSVPSLHLGCEELTSSLEGKVHSGTLF